MSDYTPPFHPKEDVAKASDPLGLKVCMKMLGKLPSPAEAMPENKGTFECIVKEGVEENQT